MKFDFEPDSFMRCKPLAAVVALASALPLWVLADVPGHAGRRAAVLLAIISLSGCADLLAVREQFVQGWRQARVVQIDAGASIDRESELDCRKATPPDAAANGCYAVYEYKDMRKSRYHIAPLPDNVKLKVGVLVRVNIKNCSSPSLRPTAQ